MPIAVTEQSALHSFPMFPSKMLCFPEYSDGQIKADVCSCAKGNMFWGEFNEKENGIKEPVLSYWRKKNGQWNGQFWR